MRIRIIYVEKLKEENNALINKLNDKLRSIGIKKYFEKLYLFKDKVNLDNFLHNIELVKNEEIKENEELNMILNKTIFYLYEEYINPDKFKIN